MKNEFADGGPLDSRSNWISKFSVKMKKVMAIPIGAGVVCAWLGAISSLAGASDVLPLGEWEQPCHGGVMRTEYITSSEPGAYRAVLSEVFHREAECENPLLSLISEGSLAWPELPADSGTPNGARAIDFRFERVLAVFRTSSGANAARISSFCGLTHWEMDRAVEITGLSCAFVPGQKPWSVPRTGDARYGIYRTGPWGEAQAADRKYLQWGKMTRERNGLDPSLRPSEWDPQVYLSRGTRE